MDGMFAQKAITDAIMPLVVYPPVAAGVAIRDFDFFVLRSPVSVAGRQKNNAHSVRSWLNPLALAGQGFSNGGSLGHPSKKSPNSTTLLFHFFHDFQVFPPFHGM